MAEIHDFPVTETQTWSALAEQILRPRLASLNVDSETAEHVVAKVRTVYYKLGLGRGYTLPLTSDEVRAACIEQVRTKAMDFYLPFIIALLWEIALREIVLYQHDAAARAKLLVLVQG